MALKNIENYCRYLFWSQTAWNEYGKPIAEIYRANLTGGDMKKIVFGNVSIISGMAIDHLRSKLYWSDGYLKTIESSDFNGNNRITFLKNTEVHQ